MAHVPGFMHDVFISFAHDDNQSVPNRAGWVTLFDQTLTGLLPREVAVWRDRKLDSNNLLQRTLDLTVSKAAVLVCVLSRNYFQSDWCRRELSTFWESRHEGLEARFGDKLRVFKVLVEDVDLIRAAENGLQDYAADLRDTLGKTFFETEPAETEFTQLMWPQGLGDRDKRYTVRMEKLAGEIRSLLDAMRQSIKVGSKSFEDTAPRKIVCTMYLAEVTDDLEDERYLFKCELERMGVRVLPEELLSNKRSEAEEQIRAALEESQFAVHLLSEKYGKPLRGDNAHCSLPHVQYQLSLEHAKQHRKFDRLAWFDAEETNRSNLAATQEDFLYQIEHEPEDVSPIDFQTGTLQRLKESIVKRVGVLNRPTAPKTKRPLIYVTGQPSDIKAPDVESLITYLKPSHDVVAYPTAEEGQPRRRLHERYCQNSDGLLLLYGEAASDWVQEQALDVRELAERRREKPLAAAVYEGLPAEKEQLPFHFENVTLVNGRAGFAPDNLRLFLDRVGSL